MYKSFCPSLVSNLHAHEMMKTDLITLSPETNVFAAVDTLIKNQISGAPVVDQNQRLLGVKSFRRR